ncbi:Ribosomal RNA large subunit methyltransferase H [Candidatus Saccharimonas aalborgensis]|uniref:Ribosomal RNA large subunit methyltransferase H n=1 Tax=Candidatus Saccharimonas aalborgensis TaxID=1332188 RepID=R4PMX6_9BACT|nr:23S rRNA (pseudouridine(1915)-N(3))-methyltransferase RlmH [Candidatus Saccharimonas aalborgensis]AGL62254.1 Ribosomal RNA large subunit methyltransferase H [Candidatus Saccharimonas aalborgensis]QQR51013.1 MAG: 23S rRNA (pseudouridine(1915)-N(3))-methyltransferase RlmH [Candidatus Saccharibacteria bacterium]QQS68762.1 MAG: 23S rRNA (pseudouridine(1915)-N(3))-methyltransferase RlmH [Candidatus Saccharibacteria bacterium]QQS71048.1 MAG: 23S rRNA (pseudouridine(1915)-N(3))-methyltransferase Rl
MITLVTVGKKHDALLVDAIQRYQQRLRAPWNVKWEVLPHSSMNALKAVQEESRRILKRIQPSDYVILLDENGLPVDSPAMSRVLKQQLASSRHVSIVIGGAYGVSSALKERANSSWSLSPLVFPHQLVRLIIIEQLYRAQSIANHTPYHHD